MNTKFNTYFIEYLRSHMALEHFDYDLAIDWSIELINNGDDSDNVLMLASCSKPASRADVATYLDLVLKEKGLTPVIGNNARRARVRYLIMEGLESGETMQYLTALYKLYQDYDCLRIEDDAGLTPFYRLYHGWDELQAIGANYYYNGLTKDNLNECFEKEGNAWLTKYPLS